MPEIIVYGIEEFRRLKDLIPSLPSYEECYDYCLLHHCPTDYFIFESLLGNYVVGKNLDYFINIYQREPMTLREYEEYLTK